jgi:hypothetical protein
VRIDGFEESRKWTGRRPGWVFKAGEHGIGYYRDGYQKPVRPTPLATHNTLQDGEGKHENKLN